MARFQEEHAKSSAVSAGRGIVLALAPPALVLSLCVANACGGAGSSGQLGSGDETLEGGAELTPGSTSGASTGSSGSSSSPGSFSGSGNARSCGSSSADLAGCACKPGTRKCYSGAAASRGVGACHDGTQTCSSGELPAWGPCMGQVLPVPCEGGPCNAKTACVETPDAAPAPVDSGIPPHCHIVQGYNGNGTLADGSLYCEGQFGGGFGGGFGGDAGSLFGL